MEYTYYSEHTIYIYIYVLHRRLSVQTSSYLLVLMPFLVTVDTTHEGKEVCMVGAVLAELVTECGFVVGLKSSTFFLFFWSRLMAFFDLPI